MVGKSDKLGPGCVNALMLDIDADDWNASLMQNFLGYFDCWPHQRDLIGAIFMRGLWHQPSRFIAGERRGVIQF
jgi:hypothetical protein